MLDARLHVVSEGLLRFKNEMFEKANKFNFQASAITTYRDLSQLKPLENLYTPNFSYSLTLKDLPDEIENLLSREACLTLSQVYEVLESYLIQILSGYFSNNQSQLTTLGLLNTQLNLSPSEIRSIVVNNQRKNNSGLISLIRKISKHYKEHETKNIHNVNIARWFDLISMIRHLIVHNRQEISKGFLDYLQKNAANKSNQLFDMQFKEKIIDGKVCIFLTPLEAKDILCWINSFAHFVFKSLSIELGLSLSVPQYSPTYRFSY